MPESNKKVRLWLEIRFCLIAHTTMTNLALDYLREHLANKTQLAFAQAAGMTAQNIGDILRGDVAISDRNLPKLLRAFDEEAQRQEFLAAYLRDRVPNEYADVVQIVARGAAVRESTSADVTADLLEAFTALPSDLYRRRVVRLLQQLRRDDALRDLFVRTVAYLEEADTAGATVAGNASGSAAVSSSSPVEPLIQSEDARRAARGDNAGDRPSSSAGKPARTRGRERD